MVNFSNGKEKHRGICQGFFYGGWSKEKQYPGEFNFYLNLPGPLYGMFSVKMPKCHMSKNVGSLGGSTSPRNAHSLPPPPNKTHNPYHKMIDCCMRRNISILRNVKRYCDLSKASKYSVVDIFFLQFLQ